MYKCKNIFRIPTAAKMMQNIIHEKLLLILYNEHNELFLPPHTYLIAEQDKAGKQITVMDVNTHFHH